jgi:hypothetical protein
MAGRHGNRHKTERQKGRLKEYFVPGDGIDWEVIQADICRYLGSDARVRPGVDSNKGVQIHGYFYTAYRNLTSAMISDLKVDSAKWEQERRASGDWKQDTDLETHRFSWEDTASTGTPVAEVSDLVSTSHGAYGQSYASQDQWDAAAGQPAAGYTGSGQVAMGYAQGVPMIDASLGRHDGFYGDYAQRTQATGHSPGPIPTASRPSKLLGGYGPTSGYQPPLHSGGYDAHLPAGTAYGHSTAVVSHPSTDQPWGQALATSQAAGLYVSSRTSQPGSSSNPGGTGTTTAPPDGTTGYPEQPMENYRYGGSAGLSEG